MKVKGKLLLIYLSTFLLISCGGKGPDTDRDVALDNVTIAQWGQEKYLIYLPLYLAIEKDFFKQEGISVSLKYSGNDDQVFATVIKGDAQFGVGDPLFTAISRERGFKGKVVATIVNGVAIWGVTDEDIPYIAQIEDFAGLKVGTFPSPSTNYTLMKRTILNSGLTLKDTKIVEAPIGSQLALLESDNADIAMELEPATSLAISKGYKLVFSSPSFYGPFSFTGISATEEYINMNSDVVQRVVNSLERAVQYCHSELDSTIEIASSLFPNIDKSVITMAVNRMISEQTLPIHVLTSDSAWQNAMKVRLVVGDLSKSMPTEDSVDNSFALEAMKYIDINGVNNL